jgi:copper homeostasis protein
MKAKLEIACFDLASAKVAMNAGAHRIEYSNNYAVGGVTPILSEVEELLGWSKLPIHVLIRCRPGDFCYSSQEIDVMQTAILAFAALGVHGFVFGCLNAAGEITHDGNELLIAAANGLPCYFHRAFDGIKNWQSGLNQLHAIGFKGVLTAQRFFAPLQADFEVICGGGVRANNLATLVEQTNAPWFHSAALQVGSNIASAKEIEDMLTILNK